MCHEERVKTHWQESESGFVEGCSDKVYMAPIIHLIVNNSSYHVKTWL